MSEEPASPRFRVQLTLAWPLLSLDSCRFNDRPPFLDFRLVESTERPWCLLLVRWNVLAEIGEPLTYRQIGQCDCDRCIELGDDLVRSPLGCKESLPLRKFQPGEPRLADVWNARSSRQSAFGHHGKRLNRPGPYLLNAIGRRLEDQINLTGHQIL